jgi:hypothetical protein
MQYKSSENNTELGLRSNIGVPTGFSVKLKPTLKSDNAKSGCQSFISGVLKSFSVRVGVSVILILTLNPSLSVSVKPGVMQTPTKN